MVSVLDLIRAHVLFFLGHLRWKLSDLGFVVMQVFHEMAWPVSEASFVIRDSLLSWMPKNANERRKDVRISMISSFRRVSFTCRLNGHFLFRYLRLCLWMPSSFNFIGVILFIITCLMKYMRKFKALYKQSELKVFKKRE